SYCVLCGMDHEKLDKNRLSTKVERRKQPIFSTRNFEANTVAIEHLCFRGSLANIIHRGPIRGFYEPIPTLKRNGRFRMRLGVSQENVARNQPHASISHVPPTGTREKFRNCSRDCWIDSPYRSC